RYHVRRRRGRDGLSAMLRHREGWRDGRLSGGRPKTHHDLRFQEPDLGVEPHAACRDLASIWLLVQATLSGGTPLEVLHGIRDIDSVPVDTGRLERLVEHASRRAGERLAGDVLFVAGRLAEECALRRWSALAVPGL